jgi:hypothetical protein
MPLKRGREDYVRPCPVDGGWGYINKAVNTRYVKGRLEKCCRCGCMLLSDSTFAVPIIFLPSFSLSFLLSLLLLGFVGAPEIPSTRKIISLGLVSKLLAGGRWKVEIEDTCTE